MKKLDLKLFFTVIGVIFSSQNSWAGRINSTPVKISVISTPPSGSMDFATRCASVGVIKCVGFDSPSDFDKGSGGLNGAFGYNSGIMPPSGTSDYTKAIQDTSIKASGTGSLKFIIPSNSGGDAAGAYFTNFSDDLSIQFDGNSVFYVQWRQRFSPAMLKAFLASGGGNTAFKQVIIGTGDKPGCSGPTSASGLCYSSCSALETVVFDYWGNHFPAMYNSCTGSATHGPFDGFYEAFNSSDFKLQNARTAPYCLYSQGSTGYFPPNGNCYGYAADEWMTFQVQIKTGARIGDEFKNSNVKLWVARAGQPSQLVIDWGTDAKPYNLSAGPITEGLKFGKVWFTPYMTNKSTAQTHAEAYTWYDELIISRNKIADPK